MGRPATPSWRAIQSFASFSVYGCGNTSARLIHTFRLFAWQASAASSPCRQGLSVQRRPRSSIPRLYRGRRGGGSIRPAASGRGILLYGRRAAELPCPMGNAGVRLDGFLPPRSKHRRLPRVSRVETSIPSAVSALDDAAAPLAVAKAQLRAGGCSWTPWCRSRDDRARGWARGWLPDGRRRRSRVARL